MNDGPTVGQARAALAEVSRRKAWVGRADLQLRLILVALGAIYVTLGIVVATLSSPRQLSAPGRIALLILAGSVVALVVWCWRIRAYSRWGLARFNLSVAVFSMWNAAIVSVSVSTGWWGGDQPGIHFMVSALVAALPLLLAAWVAGWQRR
jgi:hypothetical protein